MTALAEVTCIGSELMAMGKITGKQLEEAKRRYHKAINNGHPDAQFGDILIECGFVTPSDIQNAIRSQQTSRDIKPSNYDDVQSSIRNLKNMVSDYQKTTTKRLKAVSLVK